MIKKRGAMAGWLIGSNTTCRRHIGAFHYKEYSRRCQDKGYEEKPAAVPKSVLEERERNEAEGKKSGMGQQTLDGVVQKVEGPTAFSRAAILDAVVKHVVCSDEVRA